MAFPSDAGWSNLPNGNFSSVIYSKKVQLEFRKATVCGAITNSDYFGEISQMGDSVRIIKEPEITVTPLERGTPIQVQDLQDDDFTLVVDQANYFNFQVDDIEKQQAHNNWMDLASNRAAYRLADQHDAEVLGYLSGYAQSAVSTNADTVNTTPNGTKADVNADNDELLPENKLDRTAFGTISTGSSAGDSIPVAPRLPGQTALATNHVSPNQIVARMGRLLDQKFVDKAGRWLVIDPVMMEVMQDEDSRFLNADWGDSGGLRNGLVLNNWNGFRVYMSNNLPVVGTGAGTPDVASQSDNYGVIVAGHDSAVATAEQINNTETYRSHDTFADVVRGMHLYGRKILRPEALVTARYNIA